MRANFSFLQRWSNREKKLTSSQKQLINWKKKHMKQWQPRPQKRGRKWGEHSVCYSKPPEIASGPLGKEGNSNGAHCWPQLEQSWKSGEVKGVNVHSTRTGKEGLPKRALEVQRSPFPPCPVREGPPGRVRRTRAYMLLTVKPPAARVDSVVVTRPWVTSSERPCISTWGN